MERNDIVKAIKMVMGLLEKENPEVHKAVASEINDLIAPKQEVVKSPPNMIFEVVKERRKRVGVMVGLKQDGTIKIGWSKCNRKLGDKFDQNEGISLAEARAIKMASAPQLPLCMGRQMANFQNRCRRYFKDADKMEIYR